SSDCRVCSRRNTLVRGSDKRRAISGAVKLLFSPPNRDRMPSPWASAGTMYLLAVGGSVSVIAASVQHKAAVDRQQLPGDEARALPQQEHHRAGDVLRHLRALHGAAGDVEVLAVLRHILGRLDLHQA